MTTTTRVPMGSSMMSLNMLCSAMGRLYSDSAKPGASLSTRVAAGRLWLMMLKVTWLFEPPSTSSTAGFAVCHSSSRSLSTAPARGSNSRHWPSSQTCTRSFRLWRRRPSSSSST